MTLIAQQVSAVMRFQYVNRLVTLGAVCLAVMLEDVTVMLSVIPLVIVVMELIQLVHKVSRTSSTEMMTCLCDYCLVILLFSTMY